MPAPNLKPRVPGEAPPPTDATPNTNAAGDAGGDDQAAQLRAELEAIASLNVPDVLEAVATMTRDELVLLRELETEGKGRVTVLGPIDDQLNVLAGGEREANSDTPGGTAAAAGRLDDALAGKSHAEGAAKAEAASASSRRTSSGGPVTKAEQPAAVLTADGWVVPEPAAEPKA